MKDQTERRVRQWTRPGSEFEAYERADGSTFIRERRLDRFGMIGEWRVISDTAAPPATLFPGDLPLRDDTISVASYARKRPQLDIALGDVSEVLAAIDDALVSVRALAAGEVRRMLEDRLDSQRLILMETLGEVGQYLQERREGAQEDAWEARRDGL